MKLKQHTREKKLFQISLINTSLQLQKLTKSCSECEIYRNYQEKCIPEFTGAKSTGRCKYSYED